MPDHRLTLYSAQGDFLTELEWKSIDCTLAERDVGMLAATLFPYYPDSLFQRDSRLAYERAPQGAQSGSWQLVGGTCWLLCGRERTLDESGEHSIVLEFAHPNHIISRHLNAYDESNAFATINAVVSDAVRSLIVNNFTAATDTTRNLDSTHFAVDAALGSGPTVQKAAAYQNVLEAIKQLTDAAAAQGTYCGYEIYVPALAGPYRFRVYLTQRGADRSSTSNTPLIISPETTHMTGANVYEKWTDVRTYAYASGAGQQGEATVRTAEDTTLSGQSPFGRSEVFQSFSTNSSSVLDSEAQHLLRKYRPQRSYESSLNLSLSTGGYRFGVDFDWGDLVAARFRSPIVAQGRGFINEWIQYQFDCRVDPVRITAARTYAYPQVPDPYLRYVAEHPGPDPVGYQGYVGVPQILEETETIDITLRSIASAT